MENIDTYAVLGLVFYLIAQLGIAFVASRFIKTEADYLLAGRHLGMLVLSLSLFATWFGAETVVASSGAIAAEGLSGGRAEPFGYALCLVLLALLLAYRLRDKGFVTVADFYQQRFGGVTEKLSVILMVPTSLIWAAAQALAFSHIIGAVVGVDTSTALLVGTVLLVTYTMIGGFLGDVISDCVQSIIIVVGLIVTAYFVVEAVGGWDAAVATITPERLSLIAPDTSQWAQFDEWAIAIVGSLAAQEAIARVLAARSPATARASCFGAAGLYLAVGLIPVFIGLVGASVVTVGESADAFLPQLVEAVLPKAMYVIFLGALTSAILSTIDSTLLSISALIGHNLVLPLSPHMNEKSKVMMERGIVLIAGIWTYSIAVGGQSIYDLIEMSSSFGSAGLVTCMIFGLWTGFGGRITALICLLSGVVFAYIFQYVWEWEAGYSATLAACVAVYIVLGMIEKTGLFQRSVKPANA
jgi:SSS family transporter